MNMREFLDKRGTIRITEMLFEEIRIQDLQKIFERFIPMKAEFDYPTQCFVYTGYSVDFDVIPEGEVIPTYDVQVRDNSVYFKKYK